MVVNIFVYKPFMESNTLGLYFFRII